MRRPIVWGALFTLALPLFSQAPDKVQALLRFTLDESPDQIIKLLGSPSHIDDSLKGYQSWQYEAPPEEDRDDNSPPAWFVCVRSADRRILSVTRNFDKAQDVDALFPAAESEAHHWPSKDAPQFSVRLRQMSGESLLLAMGAAKPGERTSQLILIRRSALKTFMPWLAEQLR
jgi:hypothetical protein